MNTLLKQLTDYAETRAEFEYCDARNGAWDWTSFSDRWKAAKRKLEGFSFPPREQVEAACLEELQQLAGKAVRLQEERRAALLAELEAYKIWLVAKAISEYSDQHQILGIDVQAARTEARATQAAYNAAIDQRRRLELARGGIFDYIREAYPGADLKTPSTWPSVVKERVERILAPYYQPEPAGGQRWG